MYNIIIADNGLAFQGSLNITELLDEDLMIMENYTYCNNGIVSFLWWKL